MQALWVKLFAGLLSLLKWIPTIVGYYIGRQSIVTEQKDKVIQIKDAYAKKAANHRSGKSANADWLLDDDKEW